MNAVARRVASRLVSNFLQRFVRTVAGEEVSALRVQLTGGALVLLDLDLNLAGTAHARDVLTAAAARLTACGAALTPAGGVVVQRAYAAELRITVPWGALATEPLEVRRCPHQRLAVASPDVDRALRRWRCTAWRLCSSAKIARATRPTQRRVT